MRLFTVVAIILISICSIISGQEIFITYDSETPLLIPADEIWRDYQIPIELINQETGEQTITLTVSEPYTSYFPDSSIYFIDLLRFTNGYVESFEDTIVYDASVTNETSVIINETSETPDSSSTGLSISYSRFEDHPIEFSVFFDYSIDTNTSPDAVGLWLRAQNNSDYKNYAVPSGKLLRYEIGESYYPHTILDFTSGINYHVATTTYTYDITSWKYFHSYVSHIGYAIEDNYQISYSTDEPSLIQIDYYTIDFTVPEANQDTIYQFSLLDEGFQMVIDQPVFVKTFCSPIFSELSFAYRIGLINHQFGGTSIERDLVAYTDGDTFHGEVGLSSTLGVMLELNTGEASNSYKSIYPLDTLWNTHHIPLIDLEPAFSSSPSISTDSIHILLEPDIYRDLLLSDRLEFSGIYILRGSDTVLVLDEFDGGFDWQYDHALSSWMEFTPHVIDYPFYSDNTVMLEYGTHDQLPFLGMLEKSFHFDSPIELQATDKLGICLRNNETSVKIDEHRADQPQNLVLHPAYPNPFNPVTTIRYELPERMNVRLAIYDLLGREVAVMVDGSQPPGAHTLRWKASEQAAGIYFMRLSTTDREITRKLLLLK